MIEKLMIVGLVFVAIFLGIELLLALAGALAVQFRS